MTKATEQEDDFRTPAEREADAYEWEAVSEDEGEEIVLERERLFVGTYRGVKVVGVLNPESMVKEDTNLYLFVDTKGDRRSLWGSYRIDQAWEGSNAPKPGDIVKVEWHGKADIGGGRSMNRISVSKAAAR